MLPSDGKIIMCTKKPVIHFSQNCTCAKRNSQWASTYQRNLRCHHSMAARCLEYNGRHIQNKSKQYKCWKFWQDDKMYCVMKGLQNLILLILSMINSSFKIEILPLYSSLKCYIYWATQRMPW